MRRVELFELIRADYEKLGLCIREIERKRHVHRRTVRQALASSVPPDRKTPARACLKLTDELKGFIDAILRQDKTAPRKQRHTARRIWQRCRDEQGSDIAEGTIRNYVAARRREMGIGVRAFVPQHHEPGAQGEADFYNAYFEFPWGMQDAEVIIARSEYSGGALHTAYPAQTQSAMFEGISKSFEFLCGSPRIMRFDNLPLAVKKKLRGRQRIENDRFIAYRSHYMFDASFTSPGIEGAHEKGGVEGEVGRFRRRWLTPVPKVSSWAEANEYLLACSIADMDRTQQGETLTVGEKMAIEKEFLRPLPEEPFETSEVTKARVDEKARISVKRVRYSVPARLVGRDVSVKISPLSIEISHGNIQVAIHDRSYRKGDEVLDLDHYLDLLAERPGAFPGSLPLHQARTRGEFPRCFERMWRKLVSRHGERDGTRQLVEVLLLHRTHKKDVVRQAVNQALDVGTIDPATVAMFARRIETGEPPGQQALFVDVGELGRYDRPLPETSSYDSLLVAAQ